MAQSTLKENSSKFKLLLFYSKQLGNFCNKKIQRWFYFEQLSSKFPICSIYKLGPEMPSIITVNLKTHRYFSLQDTVFIFVKNQSKKRFLAKLGLEPGTKRVSTGGCLNHSATQLVIKVLAYFCYLNHTNFSGFLVAIYDQRNELEWVRLVKPCSLTFNATFKT